MSEKRFTLREGLTFEFSNIQDNGNDLSFEDIVDLLNELSTSCRQLEGEVKSLNAFLVHKGFAEEYIRWKGDV